MDVVPRSRVTHDVILDSALVVLERGGLRGSRMEDIAAEAGVSRQSVYYHFRSREEVLSALIERGLADLAASVRAGVTGERLEDFVLAAVRFFADNETLCRLLVTEMWGVAGDPQTAHRIIDRVEEEIIAPVARRIAAATRAGEADCADPALAARALVGQVTAVAFGLIAKGQDFHADHVGQQLVEYARAVLGVDRGAP